jgi:hypothetical protein
MYRRQIKSCSGAAGGHRLTRMGRDGGRGRRKRRASERRSVEEGRSHNEGHEGKRGGGRAYQRRRSAPHRGAATPEGVDESATRPNNKKAKRRRPAVHSTKLRAGADRRCRRITVGCRGRACGRRSGSVESKIAGGAGQRLNDFQRAGDGFLAGFLAVVRAFAKQSFDGRFPPWEQLQFDLRVGGQLRRLAHEL